MKGQQEQDAVLSAEEVRDLVATQFYVVDKATVEFQRKLVHQAQDIMAQLARSHEALRVRADQEAKRWELELARAQKAEGKEFTLRAEADSLRRALREYADEDNWVWGDLDGRWTYDVGRPRKPPWERASAALAAADATQEGGEHHC